jgi:hypothetical protein
MVTISDKMVPYDQCVDDVRRMARRTAMLYHFFVATLEDHLGKDQARALTEEAIWRYGDQIGRETRAGVEAMGLANDVENYGQHPDLPSVGWEGAEAQTEDGPRHRVHYCPLAAVWQEMGSEAVGRIYCTVDQAKYRAFNPRAKLIHTCNMLDGDPYCEFDIQLEQGDEG